MVSWSSFSALRADWREIGGLGRLALMGIVLALVGMPLTRIVSLR
jgi:hypothetical protein